MREVGRTLPSFSAVDLAVALADLLPSGLYTGAGIEEYVRTVLSDPDRSDDFRELPVELYLAATDLDTCERIVLGAAGWDDVPISTAVRASTALPMVYQPAQVKDRELVDGGIVSTTNLDIAVEAGAKLIVVVNPLVPVRERLHEGDPDPVRHARRAGSPTWASRGSATRPSSCWPTSACTRSRASWRERYPGVDIVLIEPDTDDELMFQTNILDYRSRLEVARHGFQSVTVKLAADYEELREVCARHGIEISATRVRKVVRHFEAQKGEKARAWRRILEQTTGTLLRQSAGG